MTDLSKAFALAVPHEKALKIRDDVAFFQAVKAVLTKSVGDGKRSPAEVEFAIRLAKEMREANRRGEKLGLMEDEVAFYDALEVNDSAVAILGDETLRTSTRELMRAINNKRTIDWTVRENVRAQMRVIIKRILRKYGYPPDKQVRATELVLEQAEVLCQDWVEGQ